MAPSATSSPPSPVHKANHVIPVIEFSPLLSSNFSQRLHTARAILDAFRNSGFLYLSHHPIPTSTVSNIFSYAARFFDRPQAQKDALSLTNASSNRGYLAAGREKVSQYGRKDVDELRKTNPDLKESFEIGREGVVGYPNRWPDEMDQEGEEFKKVMQEFFLQCKEVYVLVMRAIALGMGLDEYFFDEYTEAGDNNLRLLHYPAVSKKVFGSNKGQERAGEHSDYGSITLLFQDMKGGLQVQSPNGEFLDAIPIEGTIVVNAGDLLARWSNDLIKSTTHRVVEPSLEKGNVNVDGYPARYSVPYFCNPDFDKWIEALPGTWEESGKKYEGINSGVYLEQRLRATY